MADSEHIRTRTAEGDVSLKNAWERFALYDFNAVRKQNTFNRLLLSVLILGVLGTSLALAETQATLFEQKSKVADISGWARFIHYPVVVVPIAISVLIAAANRFKLGKTWVLLRGGAETIKREIFSYRTQAGDYRAQQIGENTRESVLAKRIEMVSSELMQTEVNVTPLHPYRGPIPPPMYGAAAADDGFSYLRGEEYVKIRIGDQLNYFERKVIKLGRLLRALQWSIYIFGGIGTLLAAFGYDLWIALTTTIGSLCATYIGLNEIENSVAKYNQTATNLLNTRDWWTALSAAEQADPQNVDKLVADTEKILEGELSGWVQHMQEALAELRHPQREHAPD